MLRNLMLAKSDDVEGDDDDILRQWAVALSRDFMSLIVGCGSMGSRYYELLQDFGVPTESIYVCDAPFDEDLRDDLGVEHMDLAIIASPGNFHVDQLCSIAATFPDAAILVEKPLSNGRLDDHAGKLLPELFSRTIAVGYNWRFHPMVQELRNLRGCIEHLTLHVADDMERWPGKSYGMPLYEFSHELDLIRFLLKSPRVAHVEFIGGEYRIHGTHKPLPGKAEPEKTWNVVIHPASSVKRRSFEVTTNNGLRFSSDWPVDAHVIGSTYLSSVENVLTAWLCSTGSQDLVCPLSEGVATAQFIDDVAGRV
jgi:predicted dehydrogenase